jgi:homocysteine S-methyltransferase
MKNNPVSSILNHHPALVIDGALATELENRGYDLKDELWSARILLEKPEAIKRLHFDYFKAGADCAITASYQATIEGFVKRGLNQKEAIELIQKSVKLALEARDDFWADETNHAGHVRPVLLSSKHRHWQSCSRNFQIQLHGSVFPREMESISRKVRLLKIV